MTIITSETQWTPISSTTKQPWEVIKDNITGKPLTYGNGKYWKLVRTNGSNDFRMILIPKKQTKGGAQ